ncbi:hypothetical protein RSAG8_12292, partial [Rhizoctonia solani AG-8 WAC10335]
MRKSFKAALAASICVYGTQAVSQHGLHPGQHPLTGQIKPGANEFKVAIIGAGAAGSSAAFWLSRAKSRLGENVTITIYDKNNYIGGRSTTVRPYDDATIPTVELGASIYVDANKNIARAVKEFNLSTVEYGDENEETGYLTDNGVNLLFVHELVEAATRVNYGQNVDDIHALEGMVSMAANGAHSVAGGNWRVFERWVKESGAKVHLGTTVQQLRQGPMGKWHLAVEGADEETYDAVVLAAPYNGTGIKLEAPGLDPQTAFPPVNYVHLHVTLLATTAKHPQGSYFFPTAPETIVPQTILTTASGPIEPEFNSLTYHERIEREGQPPEYIVKIFSKSWVTGEWLERVFGAGNVGWIHRTEWDAYPRLPPTTTYPSVKPAVGLYYVNAFEPFISTMETETIASLNAVDLLLHDRYGRGVCGYKTEDDYPSDERGRSSFARPLRAWSLWLQDRG